MTLAVPGVYEHVFVKSRRPDGDTRRAVRRLLAEGLTKAEAARRLGISKPTVTYHASRLGLPIDERGARRYDWNEVQRYYDEGHTVSQCVVRFGFARRTDNHLGNLRLLCPNCHSQTETWGGRNQRRLFVVAGEPAV